MILQKCELQEGILHSYASSWKLRKQALLLLFYVPNTSNLASETLRKGKNFISYVLFSLLAICDSPHAIKILRTISYFCYNS